MLRITVKIVEAMSRIVLTPQIAKDRPDWSDQKVRQEARRLSKKSVFMLSNDMAPERVAQILRDEVRSDA